MPESSPLKRPGSSSVTADGGGLDLALIRARVGGRTHRSVMADASIAQALPEVPNPTQRRAAVALILRERLLGPEVLLIRRAEHPSDPWSGHMAFPGGREEPFDGDLLQTAVRETREELGLDLDATGLVVGRLDELPAVARGKRTGLTIAPFVFELKPSRDEPTLSGNYEVAEALWTPLAPMLSGQQATKFPYEIAGQRMELPAYDVDGRIVWGLTHRMLESLFALLR